MGVRVAASSLTQSQIDALIASETRTVQEYDYQGSSVFDREVVEHLERQHKSFCSELTRQFSHTLNVTVLVEPRSVDESVFQSYVRSLPSPTVLGIVALDPLPGRAVVDVSSHLGFAMLDILLGGPGRAANYRRFTELEASLIAEMMNHTSGAISAAFEGIVELDPTVLSIQTQPNIGHVAVSTEPALIFTFAATIATARRTEGLISICYPLSSLEPVLGVLATETAPEAPKPDEAALGGTLTGAGVPLSARLNTTRIALSEIAHLQPGDVIVLDHDVDDPVLVSAGGVDVLEAAFGRQKDALALSITGWKV